MNECAEGIRTRPLLTSGAVPTRRVPVVPSSRWRRRLGGTVAGLAGGMIRNRRSTWSSGDRPKADLHVGEEWEQLSPEEREVAAALRMFFGEEKFASIPGDLVVPFIRGYAEETSCEGPGFVQQLLADSLAWRARVGADSTGQLSSCARPCPALACLAVRAPRPPPPENNDGHRLPRPLGAPSTAPTDPVP